MTATRNLLVIIAAAATFVWCQSADANDRDLISWQRQQLTTTYYSEGAAFGDLNNDGHVDVVSGPYWYAGPAFKNKHALYPPKAFAPNQYPDNFFSFVYDLNGDGWNDVLVLPFPGKAAWWMENPGKRGDEGRATSDKGDGYWKRHVVVNEVGNESPTWVDITGDGKPEVVCSQGGYYGFASPDWSDPTKPWRFRRISDKSAGGKFTHGMGVGDINGDGRADLIEKRGWWEQPASLDGDPQWKFHKFAFTPAGGSQMFAYDFDGDGDNDIVTSMAAHAWGLSWYETIKNDKGAILFKQHVIMGYKGEPDAYGVAYSQLHALDLADIDGDGVKDIVTGKTYRAHHGRDPGGFDPAVVYWYKTVRSGEAGKVDFVPHRVDRHSGVGRQVMAGDINGDKIPDIVVGNAMGTFVHIQSRKKVSEAKYNRSQPYKVAAPRPLKQGLAPKEAAQYMTVPNGFQVDLIAAEPDVTQPVAMTIDHKGRLWIAEAHTYPQRAPGNKTVGDGKDRIIILEDTDGDGSFETRKVFTEKLNLVSGLEVGFGGVWVGAAPYLMFIPDKNGDDKPDGDPVVLLDGWGYQDTHETLNSFTWGPDGWLYGCHGVFTHSRVGKPGTPNDKRTPLNAGVWRYHPTRHQFEVFAWGTSNPWGVDFDENGQCFITACVIPHLYHMVQGGRYQRQGGKHFNPHVYDDIKTIGDHLHYTGNIRDHAHWGHENNPATRILLAGGGHAHAGAMIYLGGQFPDEYRGRIFMNNIHGARVNSDILVRKGSGFVGKHGPDLVITNDHHSQIIALRYGPDGSVYFIDWYDRNQCHRGNPQVHDRSNGRVFRLSYVGDRSYKPVKEDLSRRSDLELVKLQTHTNAWYARTARRLLQERTHERIGNRAISTIEKEAIPALNDMATKHEEATRRLRALWALHSLYGKLDARIALSALEDKSEYIRAWAIQSIFEGGQVSSSQWALLADMAQRDPSPVVRLYLASAMQRYGKVTPETTTILSRLIAHAEDANDHNLPLMYWYAIEPIVANDKAAAIKLAAGSKVPLVRQYIARRLAGGAPIAKPSTGTGTPAGYKVKGALEGEALKIASVTGGEARSQKMAPFKADKWSGVDHLWWTGGKVGDTLTLDLPVSEAGKYRLIAVLTKARDYGVFQLSLDGKALGRPIDLYNFPDVVTTGELDLGTHTLTKGTHKLAVKITGANAKAIKAYMFGLDYVKLAP